jgi:hypothetical protein
MASSPKAILVRRVIGAEAAGEYRYPCKEGAALADAARDPEASARCVERRRPAR